MAPLTVRDNQAVLLRPGGKSGLHGDHTARQRTPEARRPGYLGPAPPPGDNPHHYVFRLLAVDEPASLGGLPSYQDVEAAVTGHVLGEARLIGTYQR
jgi:phosphatidylethanolamine-binding protein (PEBP) family uncharacterized protein